MVFLLAGVSLYGPLPLAADELTDAQTLFNSGKYADCIDAAAKGIETRAWRESWWRLKIRAELETGRYADALATLKQAFERFSSSLRLRLLGRDVYRFNGMPEEAEKWLAEAEEMVRRQRWRYSDPINRVLLGKFLLLRGADAKQVLETFFDRAKRDLPNHVETYLAIGQLGLDKHDYALAAQAFQEAAKLTPDDPATHFGLATACAPSNPERTKQALARALELNPNHAGALLMTADRLIDAEHYTEAGKVLDRVLTVNAAHPAACAYRAVLAHLEGDTAGEQTWRNAALAHWSTNPHVDHLIGRELSQKYRFREGAASQRRALDFDAAHLPAKIALAQDLLRLGEEDEGWRMAEAVYVEDGYNVAAYNLVTLRETLSSFTTLEADGIRLRMDAFEADVYGRAALELLTRAKRELSAKYDVELDRPITVEIYPEQKDFAVRTFGMPGGEGFLGVCFGSVITANSPASQGRAPSNWQAVLWHEFCHVVTLSKTDNKMPRWLSEGISVYEEKQRDPSWGQSMSPLYRELVLNGGLVPVSGLSGAFLEPPSPLHLQFAYYEASLVVEYLIETSGLETLQQILADLATGESTDAVLARHAGPLSELDQKFAQFAENRARQLAPDADWQLPELPPGVDLETLTAWNQQHPNSIPGLDLLARRLVAEKKWSEAKEPLEKLIELHPGNVDADNSYLLLAAVYRELGETEAEQSVLEKLAALDADAVEANLRIVELSETAEDWERLAAAAERLLAINPLIRAPHRSLARAAEALDDRTTAISAYRELLRMDPVDPAEAHFRLARLLHQEGEFSAARRQTLQALEEAPRFRAAHRLLLELVDQPETTAPAPDATEQNP